MVVVVAVVVAVVVVVVMEVFMALDKVMIISVPEERRNNNCVLIAKQEVGEKILGSKLPKMEYSTTVSSRSGSNKSNQHFLDNEDPPHLSSLNRDRDKDREIDKDRDKTYGDHPSAAVSGAGNVPSSKFRNRLQAARDEHHFIADDYSKI